MAPGNLPPTKLSTTLTPLPTQLHDGLIIVTIFGYLSFFASLSLFGLLTWRMIQWSRSSKAVNQFVILIYNLVFADLQQSTAFILSSRWLGLDGIFVENPTCWAQGWFVSVGDLGSGAFCFFIGLHTFLSVVFNYRMSNLVFGLSIAGIWLCVYAITIIGVALHPNDIFVRAVSWCWMNSKYGDLRLWLHYFWIFTFEFGTILIYIAMFVALQYRIKSNFYSASTKQSQQARTAAKLMIVYPIIYVICTLPLATLRMVSMASTNMPSFAWFCFAGAMITSNGWLDVFLYTMTRRIMLFSDEPPPDNGLDTFTLPFSGTPLRRFGNKTTCEFTGDMPRGSRLPGWLGRHDTNGSKGSEAVSFTSMSQLFEPGSPYTFSGSPKSMNDGFAVKTKTTIEVKSEPMVSPEDMHEMRVMKEQSEVAPSSPPIGEYSEDEIEFATKPQGWPA